MYDSSECDQAMVHGHRSGLFQQKTSGITAEIYSMRKYSGSLTKAGGIWNDAHKALIT